MPRPRFDRLQPERRTALLEAAAQEFGRHGYADASLNQILERAGLSKGVAYYYFDDKEDLFFTVVQYYMDAVDLGYFSTLPETVTAETFWPSLAEVYRRAFVRSREIPWAFGVWRAAGDLWRHDAATPRLAAFIDQWMQLSVRLFKRGQELGLIRADLPDDLLHSWIRAVDDAHDRWVLAHWDDLDSEALSAAADRMVDALQRLLGCRGGAA
jgi:AcrR family transcriptional regulator